MADGSICYLGAFDERAPRNRVIRAGLEAHGWHVSLAKLPTGLDFRRGLPLLWHTMRHEARRCDALIVAEYNGWLAPLAIALGRLLRKPVLVDYLAGLYESQVQEDDQARPRSARATLLRALDGWTIATAAGVFTDTAAHRDAFRALVGSPARRMIVVPRGAADVWWTAPNHAPRKPPDAPLLVQFFGDSIPLGGVQVIVRTLSWLNTDDRFRFEMIGRGPGYPEAVRRADLLGIRHLAFVDEPPAAELPARVAQADICLGIFGRRTLADAVMPERVFECMAMGKAVVTAESAAAREHFTPGEHLLTVPPSDPGALAMALRHLADAPAERQRLGAAAAARIRAAYTPHEVVKPLIALLERIV